MRQRGIAALLLALLLSACGGDRIPSGADVVVTGTAPDQPVMSGESATFTMTVANNGPNNASNVKIVNTVGNQLALTSIACAASGGAVCPDPTSVAMTVPTMPIGSRLVFEIIATVTPNVGGTIANTMTATIADDVDRNNNAATAVGEAFSISSDLVVTGVGPSATVSSGAIASFVMTVRNDGPDEATAVRIVNAVGSNLTLSAVTCQASGGGTCPVALGPVMEMERLPAGASLLFGIDARVGVGTEGAIVNTMNVSADHDEDRTDNSFTAVGSAFAFNLNVAASGPAEPVSGGATASVSMVVSNEGPGEARDVDIANTPDSNLSLTGVINCTASGGAICPPATGPTMRAPSIPAGGTLAFTIPLTVAAGANGRLLNVLTTTATGDSRPGDDSATAVINAVSADLGVSQEAPGSVEAGASVVFRAVVANPGPGVASDLTISWTVTAPFPLGNATFACVASVGATCPSTLGPVMAVPTLNAGRALTFTFTVPLPDSGRGSIASTVSVVAAGDPDSGNNTSSVSTLAEDARNGTYRVFAADGREYELTVDFDALRYTMAGNGASVQRSLTVGADAREFIVGGNARIRTSADLLVGSHDFGSGLEPFVAARRFATSVGQLGGLYNIATRNVSAIGGAVTRAGTARVSGNLLQICQEDFQVNVPQNCGVGGLKSYALSVAGDTYTGIEVNTGDVYTFRLALTGASAVLLSAGVAPDATRQLRIALPDASALAGGVQSGPSTGGDWVKITLNASSYLVVGSGGQSDSATLQRISNAGPFAMLSGQRVSNGQKIFVMQSSPLAVAFGDPAAAGGLLQVAVP